MYIYICAPYISKEDSVTELPALFFGWSFCPLHPRMAAMQTTCVLVFRELGSGIVDSDRDIPQNSPESGRKQLYTPLN